MSDPQGASEGTPTSQPAENVSPQNPNPYEGLAGMDRRHAEERDQWRSRAEAAEARLASLGPDNFDPAGGGGYNPQQYYDPSYAQYDPQAYQPPAQPDPYAVGAVQAVDALTELFIGQHARSKYGDLIQTPEDEARLLRDVKDLARTSRINQPTDLFGLVDQVAGRERARYEAWQNRQREQQQQAQRVDPNTLPPTGGYIPGAVSVPRGNQLLELDRLQEEETREAMRAEYRR